MARTGWKVPTSDIAKNTYNPIRGIVENLDLTPNPEKRMIALSIGDPTIFGNLRPAEEVIDAIKESVVSCKFNGYAPCNGYPEARQAVADYSSNEYYTVNPEDVILCSGCSCALDMSITALANPGQNILAPRPGFSIYRTLAEGIGVKVKHYDLKPDEGWEVDLQHLESLIDSETAAIIVNNPSNPCGSVYSRRHLKNIVDIASKYYLPIIADEIYEHLVFKGEVFYPIASVSDNVPILSCSGLTKRFLIPGWRMGWIIIHDRNDVLNAQVRKGLHNLNQRIIGSSTIVQGAIPKILANTPESFYHHTIDVIERHARLAYAAISDIEGLNPIMPQGAMYMMVRIEMSRFPSFKTDLEFVREMVSEESVFCLPGQCFNFGGYMRIVLTVPEEQLLEACQRISSFCSRHLKKHTSERKPNLKYVSDFHKYVIPMDPLTDSNSP